jgi:hypothetical protein
MIWSIHYFFHLGVPFLFAYLFLPKKWKKAYGVMILTMLVDMDHLLASPIFDPNRCSIGFHPLHTYWAIGFYILLFFINHSTLRWMAVGLIWHMMTDALDCFFM